MTRRPGAWLPVAGVVGFNAWALRSELDPAGYPHDGSVHQALVRWAAQRISHGESPLDGIFPDLGLGFPIFQHYQVLPHLLTAPVAWLFGVEPTFAMVSYLLLVLWPVCVYVSARLFELDPVAAAAAAVLAPFVVSVPGYGFEWSSYLWRGNGMWAQAWGMWLFALTAGWSWGVVFRNRSVAVGAVLFAAIFTTHLLSGICLLAAVLTWPLLASPARRSAWGRTLAMAAGGAVASAWLLVPPFVDRGGTAVDNPAGTFWRDSYGVRQVGSWLAGGGLFDSGRLPVLTLLVAAGIVAAFRRDCGRAVLALFCTSLLLFCGTSVVGPVVDRLPARDILFLHRMIVGVHFAGVLLAGIGAAALLRAARSWRPTPAPVAMAVGLVAAAVVLFAPATQSLGYVGDQSEWIEQQHSADDHDGRDFAAVVALAARQGGRIYAGSSRDWGRSYRIGHVPGYIRLLELDVAGVGFSGRVPALTDQSEARFDAESRAQAEVFDVRWQVRPAGTAGPPGAELVASRGRHNLWRTGTSGAVQLAEAGPVLAGGTAGPAVASAEFLRSDLALAGRYPLLAGAPLGVAPAATGDTGLVGRVWASHAAPTGDRYTATVDAHRRAILVVKTSAHPRWSARVDGQPAAIRTVAPGLLAVDVPPGSHHVEVDFAGFPTAWRAPLLTVGALALAALAVMDRRLGSRHSPRGSTASSRGPAPQGADGPAVLDPGPAGSSLRRGQAGYERGVQLDRS